MSRTVNTPESSREKCTDSRSQSRTLAIVCYPLHELRDRNFTLPNSLDYLKGARCRSAVQYGSLGSRGRRDLQVWGDLARLAVQVGGIFSRMKGNTDCKHDPAYQKTPVPFSRRTCRQAPRADGHDSNTSHGSRVTEGSRRWWVSSIASAGGPERQVTHYD